MIGAIIGDIIGSRFEFNNLRGSNFKLFTDRCSYTDDTICTIAIAEAILRGESYGVNLQKWCRKYPHPMGSYGARSISGYGMIRELLITALAMVQPCESVLLHGHSMKILR